MHEASFSDHRNAMTGRRVPRPDRVRLQQHQPLTLSVQLVTATSVRASLSGTSPCKLRLHSQPTLHSSVTHLGEADSELSTVLSTVVR